MFNFEKKHIVMPVQLEDLEEVARFTCYHRYGGYYGFFRPGVDEVLSQIPPGVDLDQVSAFEIHVDSLSSGEVFDAILNRHVTTVILYKITHGLPRRIARQKVNCDDQKY